MPARLLDLFKRLNFRKKKDLPELKKIVPKPRTQSRTWFKDNIPKGNFSFKKPLRFTFEDRYPAHKVTNHITPYLSLDECIVLCDKNGDDRFVLAYSNVNGAIEISAIQRIRTQYVEKMKDTYEWMPELEYKASKRFALDLGLFPSEFLLCEFIYLFSKEIKAGRTLKLRIYKSAYKDGKYSMPLIYKPLIDRFFKSNPISESNAYVVYELSLDKERVKSILGIK